MELKFIKVELAKKMVLKSSIENAIEKKHWKKLFWLLFPIILYILFFCETFDVNKEINNINQHNCNNLIKWPKIES